MVAILKISAKLATLDLERKLFWNKSYDVRIFFPDVTNKIFSCNINFDQSSVTLVFVWEKL